MPASRVTVDNDNNAQAVISKNLTRETGLQVSAAGGRAAAATVVTVTVTATAMPRLLSCQCDLPSDGACSLSGQDVDKTSAGSDGGVTSQAASLSEGPALLGPFTE